jgi:hypothetical protein
LYNKQLAWSLSGVMPSLYCALWAQVNVAISGNWALRNSETSSFAIVICETLLGGWESDFSGCENKAKDGVPQLWLEQSAPFHAAGLFRLDPQPLFPRPLSLRRLRPSLLPVPAHLGQVCSSDGSLRTPRSSGHRRSEWPNLAQERQTLYQRLTGKTPANRKTSGAFQLMATSLVAYDC